MHKKLVVLTFFLLIVTVYARSVHKSKKNEDSKEEYYNSNDFDVIYDQKQNATENYRVDISGVDMIVIPTSSLFEAFLTPLSFLGQLKSYSRKAAVPSLTKKLDTKSSDQSENSLIEVNTILTKTPDKTEEEKKIPLKNFTKNLDE